MVIGLGLRWGHPHCFSYYCSHCCLCRKQGRETEIVNGEVRLAGLWLVLRPILPCWLCRGFSVWQIGETGGSMVLCLCSCCILCRNEVLFHWVCFPQKPDKSWKLKSRETEWVNPAASGIEMTLSHKVDTRTQGRSLITNVWRKYFQMIHLISNQFSSYLFQHISSMSVVWSICWSDILSREKYLDNYWMDQFGTDTQVTGGWIRMTLMVPWLFIDVIPHVILAALMLTWQHA